MPGPRTIQASRPAARQETNRLFIGLLVLFTALHLAAILYLVPFHAPLSGGGGGLLVTLEAAGTTGTGSGPVTQPGAVAEPAPAPDRASEPENAVQEEPMVAEAQTPAPQEDTEPDAKAVAAREHDGAAQPEESPRNGPATGSGAPDRPVQDSASAYASGSPGAAGVGELATPGGSGDAALASDREAYYSLVRARIEQHKQYPAAALRMRTQGRVTLAFTILEHGDLEDLRVVTGSRSELLDAAALKAVRSSAPFPAPPEDAFSGPVRLTVPLAFELD